MNVEVHIRRRDVEWLLLTIEMNVKNKSLYNVNWGDTSVKKFWFPEHLGGLETRSWKNTSDFLKTLRYLPSASNKYKVILWMPPSAFF